MPGTFPITIADVGRVLDSDASIVGVRLNALPPMGAYEVPYGEPGGLPLVGAFCLTDVGAPGVPRQLINTYPHVDGHTRMGSDLLALGGVAIPFRSLRVQACPRGASYTVVTA